MLNKGWLPLNEYSMKYRISLSTLRRRIRGNDIQYRFDDGKYWLQDAPISKTPHGIHASHFSRVAAVSVAPALAIAKTQTLQANEPQFEVRSTANEVVQPEGLLNSAQNLLLELKSAYVKVLHDKEEQITQLKEEVIDLKTLVKILESENDRLKANLGESAPIDSWLEKNIDN